MRNLFSPVLKLDGGLKYGKVSCETPSIASAITSIEQVSNETSIARED